MVGRIPTIHGPVIQHLPEPSTRQWPLDQIALNGFAIVEHVLDQAQVHRLIDQLSAIPHSSNSRKRRGATFAHRDLLSHAFVAELAQSPSVRAIAQSVLETPRAVRAILFDKLEGANWLVPWHQDLSIAVRQRIDVAGFGPWSVKSGVNHVQPPMSILEKMVTIRLHLDDCDRENGPLRVIPGSHGRLFSPDELLQRVKTGPQIECLVPAGGAVVMRPTILHASAPAKCPSHRRVVHIEFADGELPGGLQWHSDPFQ